MLVVRAERRVVVADRRPERLHEIQSGRFGQRLVQDNRTRGLSRTLVEIVSHHEVRDAAALQERGDSVGRAAGSELRVDGVQCAYVPCGGQRDRGSHVPPRVTQRLQRLVLRVAPDVLAEAGAWLEQR